MSWFAAGMGLLSWNEGRRASKRRDRLDARRLQLEEDKYNRWLDIYGGIEENLGEYYESLSSDAFATQGLQAEAAGFAEGMDAITQYFADRGLSGSGLEDSAKSKALMQHHEDRARIKFEAPHKVAQMKQQFLQGAPGAPTGREHILGEMSQREGAAAGSLYDSAGRLLSTGIKGITRDAPYGEPKDVTPTTPSAASGYTIKETGDIIYDNASIDNANSRVA